jgi:transcriptional regulator with XRE-family HTH domain
VQEELKRIAGRVKAWRTGEGLTLQEVSERSGVSASTVHKIENLQMIPTIAVLLKVAHGLGRRPHELFDEGAVTRSAAALVRARERDQLQTREGSTLERVVGAIDQAGIDVWRVTHDPGRGSQPSPDAPLQRYRGELVILVETGRLHVEVGEGEAIEVYDLDVGDTLHFKTSLPHAWINRTDEPVSAYFFGLLPDAARRRD